MKYCTKCGNQLLDEAVICPKCGCIADQEKYDQLNKDTTKKETSVYSSSIQSIALAFMIVSTVIGAFFFFIPLAWCLPMTLHYNDCIKNKTPTSVGFKVCCLIFVSLIAGILMLINPDDMD